MRLRDRHERLSSASRRGVRPLALVAAVGLALSAFVACSRTTRNARPTTSLSFTPEAAAAFAPIQEAWRDRRIDPVAVHAFIRRYSDDGAVPLAKVYLAFAMMEHGELIAADGLLSTLAEQRRGTTRDLATVARARSLRLHNAPQSALDSLRPLVGKIVDDADREIFLEEIALSAIAAHDDYEALAYLDAWLRGVGEDDKDRVRAKIAQILETLPRAVLEQTYRTMRTRGVASGYASDTQKLVSARLAKIAVEANDAALARWLLDVSGVSAAQAGGDAGLELGELAASRRGLSVVAGRSVGLLLPTRDRELRDEAADVVRGLSWALGLPRAAGTEDGTRLVTRDDGVDDATGRAAMEELAGEGAAVIVAGFDRPSADRASAWSDETGLPVLLLTSPSPGKLPKKSAIVLGERPEREILLLADALARHGVTTAALVADSAEDEAAAKSIENHGALRLLPSVRCDIALAEAGKTRFPIDGWTRAGADGWLISGGPACGRDVLRDLGRVLDEGRGRRAGATRAPAVALTLEAGIPISEAPRNVVVVAAAAGLVPILASRPSETNEPEVRAFMDRFGARPSYWTALGRDAGVLAKAALEPLPRDSTSEAKAVAQRRAIVQAGLLATRVPLWTSDERGVAADRVLSRALRVVTWKRDK